MPSAPVSFSPKTPFSRECFLFLFPLVMTFVHDSPLRRAFSVNPLLRASAPRGVVSPPFRRFLSVTPPGVFLVVKFSRLFFYPLPPCSATPFPVASSEVVLRRLVRFRPAPPFQTHRCLVPFDAISYWRRHPAILSSPFSFFLL